MEDKIEIKNLVNNPGIYPAKIGTAKLTQYYYKLIHFYDLQPLIEEIDKLKSQSENIKLQISKHTMYLNDSSNYIKVLNFIENKLSDKLSELVPYSPRKKRGLINGLGSIFKAISGNLDASDGERYEKLILQLQNNQNKLSETIKMQNSLSIKLIDNFNNTLKNIMHNEKLLQSKLEQIAFIINETVHRENSMFIKDVLNQIIELYNIIYSITQDIENSVTFARLGIMHPSIIKPYEFLEELKRIQSGSNTFLLPIELDHENVLLLEKLIKIESYSFKNKITYILNIPIIHPSDFNLFHIYSVPIMGESQFKAVIPKNKFLIMNKLYYAYSSDSCTKIFQEQYLCNEVELQEIQEVNPCTVQFLSLKNLSTCQKHNVRVNRPIIKHIENSNQWIFIIPDEENIKLHCHHQEEILKVNGSLIIHIPEGCELSTPNQRVKNTEIYTKQSFNYPKINTLTSSPQDMDLTISLENVELDELQDIRGKILQNQPKIDNTDFSTSPSIWTVFIYISIILLISCYLIRRFISRCVYKKPVRQENPLDVQIPL